MKTERRHELQTNVLANWLGNQIEAIRPYWQIIAGVVVGMVLIAIVVGLMYKPQQRDSSPWTSLFNANSEQDLSNVVIKNPGTSAAWWAKLERADLQLETGLRFTRDDKEQARIHLDEALKDYLEVAEKAGDSELVERAHWGAAKVYESLAAAVPDDGDLKQVQAQFLQKAIDEYRILVDTAKEKSGSLNALGREGKHCLARLAGDDGKVRKVITDLYYDLATFNPQLNRSDNFLTEEDLVDVPDLSFPGEESAVVPPAIVPPSTDPSTTDPSTTDPATSDPSNTDPATTDPSATDSPASKTPASESPDKTPSDAKPSATPDPAEGNATETPAKKDAADSEAKPSPKASSEEPKSDAP